MGCSRGGGVEGDGGVCSPSHLSFHSHPRSRKAKDILLTACHPRCTGAEAGSRTWRRMTLASQNLYIACACLCLRVSREEPQLRRDRLLKIQPLLNGFRSIRLLYDREYAARPPKHHCSPCLEQRHQICSTLTHMMALCSFSHPRLFLRFLCDM